MKIMKLSLVLPALFVCFHIQAQTVVKMNLPPQSDVPLQVVALFDEEIPEGIPVVLGVLGYDITGGIEPYQFEWQHNGSVVSTSDMAVITPAKGDALTLRVIDKNKCSSSTAFNLRVATRSLFALNETGDGNIRIYPTLVSAGFIHIDLPYEEEPANALVRIFDFSGAIRLQIRISQDKQLPLTLRRGTYFISVKTEKAHIVKKIIVQ